MRFKQLSEPAVHHRKHGRSWQYVRPYYPKRIMASAYNTDARTNGLWLAIVQSPSKNCLYSSAR